MNFMSLDISTKCTGWALWKDNKLYSSGSIDLTPGDGAVGRLRLLFSLWTDILVNLPIEVHEIVYENGVFCRTSIQTASMGAAIGVIISTTDQPIFPLNVVTWRKNLTGKGNADKAEIRRTLNG